MDGDMLPSCYGILAEARSIAFTSLQQRQSIYFSCFGFAISAFQKQSSGVVLWNKFPEAYNFIKKEALAQVFFCESGQIFKNPFFTEHPHQSRFPILMLHVIHRQLRREYLLRREFLSMVERKISFSHVFSSE